jgi:hypothetical protein
MFVNLVYFYYERNEDDNDHDDNDNKNLKFKQLRKLGFKINQKICAWM